MPYQAIFSDFDGTLAGQNGLISPSLRQAIKSWTGSGKKFIIATGRQYVHLKHELENLDLPDPQIVRGGAEVVDPKTGEVIHSAYLDSSSVESLVKVLSENEIPFTAEQGGILYTPNGEPTDLVPDMDYRPVSEMTYEDIAKIVLWVDDLDDQFVADFMQTKIMGEFQNLGVIKSYTPFNKTWQITSTMVNKRVASEKVMEMLGLSYEQVIGIGDNYNDLDLLEACGLKVVVANAPQEVQQVADWVVPSYDQDGVVEVIEEYL